MRMNYFKEKTTSLVYAYSQDDLDTAENATKDTPQVFHDIKAKLKNMTKLKGTALELHLNPRPTADGVRGQRDALLKELDAFVSSPLRFADLSEDEVIELASYRQALLDVPQQSDFPIDTVMPSKPPVLNL